MSAKTQARYRVYALRPTLAGLPQWRVMERGDDGIVRVRATCYDAAVARRLVDALTVCDGISDGALHQIAEAIVDREAVAPPARAARAA